MNEKLFYIGMALSLLIGLGLIAFIVWVIIKLMQFWGVI